MRPHRQIKVLHSELTDSAAGIENLFLNLNSAVNPEEVEFDFLTCADKPALYEELTALGSTIIQLPSYKKHPIQYMRALKAVLKSGKYDFFHVHKNSTANMLPFWVAKNIGFTKVICHAHNSTANGGRVLTILHRINRRKLHRYIYDAFTCSDLAAKWLYSDWIANNIKVKMLPNGIQMEKYHFNQAQREIERNKLGVTDEFLVGMVGRIEQPKNHAFAVEMIERLLHVNKSAKLIIVGNGSLETDLRQLIQKKGLEKSIFMVGFRSDVYNILNAFDVLCMPSFNEGLPLSAVEAQANGLVCLLSNTITRECVIGDNVSFLPIDNCNQWVAALEELAGRERSTERIYSAKFDSTHAAETLIEYYRTHL